MRELIYEFYRDVFGGEYAPPLLKVSHPLLNHPVVTPHFLVDPVQPSGSPWLNVLGPIPTWLAHHPHYRRTLEGNFIRFGRKKPEANISMRLTHTLPAQGMENYQRLTCQNVQGMDSETLTAVEGVLQNVNGEFGRILALDPEGNLMGSLVTVKGRSQTLLVLGWVDVPYRKSGVMGQLLNRALERSPESAVIGWTFNRVLYDQGVESLPLTVFQKA